MTAPLRHRLHLDHPLAPAGDAPPAAIALDSGQAHYLVNVLRLKSGSRLLAFNGRDGEFEVEIAEASRKSTSVNVIRRSRGAGVQPDLMLVFAPVKRAGETLGS